MKEQYIPLSNMINFSLQLFQLTEACFRLWIVFLTSTVIYLYHIIMMLLFVLVKSRSKILTPSVSLKESISRVVESQIINDLRSSLSDVCDVMSSLDIAIGFLASSGGQPERPLKWYLHEVLKLPKDRGLKSATVSTFLLFI